MFDQKCFAVASLRIEGVFVGAQIESIQVRIPEVVIAKNDTSVQSIMGDDLDLGEMESEVATAKKDTQFKALWMDL
jgi:hypothetical protein